MATKQARVDTAKHASRKGEMSEQELSSFIGRKIQQSMNDEDGDISDVRIDSFNRYNGDLYGSERDGYSKYVTREVLETVEWVMPSVLRVFTGGDKVVVFDPINEADEERADQETDVVNHKLFKVNGGDGFLAIHNFIKDALMFPTAYVKAYVDEQKKVAIKHAKGIDKIGLLIIDQDPENEITEQNSYLKQMPVQDSQLEQQHAQMAAQAQSMQPPPQPGQPPAPPPQIPELDLGMLPQPMQEVELFDITYKRTTKKRQIKIESIPGEEALIDNDCTSVNIDTADFSCHRVRKSFTYLVQAGYDREELENVGTYEDYQWNDERTNRLFYEDEDPDAEDEDDPSMRQFWVHECRLWVDWNGDGIAEFREVVMIGSRVFSNEETDYQPMVAMSSILMPHKHNGLSLVDIVKDLQDLQTTLTRQLLDNIYRINVRRTVIGEGSLLDDGTTMEAMLNVSSEFIPVKGLAANALVPQQTQSMIGEILPVLQHLDERKANRTGINPQVNLDPGVLQQTTEGAFMGALEQASQRVEMLVRIFAETGIKQLMRKVHQLLRTYPDIATSIKLRGKWVDVDPQGWEDRTDMTVNVGLGFNDKKQMTGLLFQLLTLQKEAAGQGMASEREIFNTLEKLVDSAALGDVNQYFKDPKADDWQPPQPQPDPAVMLAQAQADALKQTQERENAVAQNKARMDEAKLTDDQQKGQAQMLHDQRQAQGKAVLETEKIRLERDKLILKGQELDLKERELAIKEAELNSNVDNTTADTNLKDEQALKTRIDGMVADKQLDEDLETDSGNDENGDDKGE